MCQRMEGGVDNGAVIVTAQATLCLAQPARGQLAYTISSTETFDQRQCVYIAVTAPQIHTQLSQRVNRL